ncbi:MAG: DUF202 domain-containing protein [Thermomicrobiales bacterium]
MSNEWRSVQLSWLRSDLSNLRTLLSWARTSVAMIGFGVTIYNFYNGALSGLGGGPHSHEAARDLGLGLVATGTLAMVVAVWNFRAVSRALERSPVAMPEARGRARNCLFGYTVSGVLVVVGLIILLFMLDLI